MDPAGKEWQTLLGRVIHHANPVSSKDFKQLMGDEGDRSIREAAHDLEALAASVPMRPDAYYYLARARWLLKKTLPLNPKIGYPERELRD